MEGLQNIWMVIPMIIIAFAAFVAVISAAAKFVDATLYVRAKIISFYKQYKSLSRQRTHKK